MHEVCFAEPGLQTARYVRRSAVPIQQKLGEAFSQATVDKLIFYHTSLRLGPGMVQLGIVLVLLCQVIRG